MFAIMAGEAQIVSEPVVTQTANGYSLCKVSIRISRRTAKKDDKGMPVYETCFINCVCWGKFAEMVGDIFEKGMYVAFAGDVGGEQMFYKDKDGNQKETPRILLTLTQIHPIRIYAKGELSRRSPESGIREQLTEAASGLEGNAKGKPSMSESDPHEVAVDDDIPFE